MEVSKHHKKAQPFRRSANQDLARKNRIMRLAFQLGLDKLHDLFSKTEVDLKQKNDISNELRDFIGEVIERNEV